MKIKGDWEDTEFAIICPFCDSTLDSTGSAFDHCKECHEFDFLETKKRLSMCFSIWILGKM
jgi:tRNA(Ile2) C34 agmatinyltransferase TiaS